MKKAQSISINTIIIAALGLAVLVVLFAIFTGRISLFPKTIDETDTCAQRCVSHDMDSGAHPTSAEAKTCSDTGSRYIGGSYKDGPYGCCCVPKS